MHFLPAQPRSTRYTSPSYQRSRLRFKTRLLKKQNGAAEGNWRYWVVVQETCRMPYDTLAGLRVLIKHHIGKLVDFKFYASYRIPVTSKPGLRMGTGKGKIRQWLTEYKQGQLILTFEPIGGPRTTKRLFRLLSHKLPVRIKILRR